MSGKKPTKVVRKARLFIGRNVSEPMELDRNIVNKMARQIREKMLANQTPTEDTEAAPSGINTSITRMAQLLRNKMNAASKVDPLSTMSVDSSAVTIPSPVPQRFTTIIQEAPKQVVPPLPLPVVSPTASVQKFGNTYKPKRMKTEMTVNKLGDKPFEIQSGVSNATNADSEDEPLSNLYLKEEASSVGSLQRRSSQRLKPPTDVHGDLEIHRGSRKQGVILSQSAEVVPKASRPIKVNPATSACTSDVISSKTKDNNKVNTPSNSESSVLDSSKVVLPTTAFVQKFGNTYQRKKIKPGKLKH